MKTLPPIARLGFLLFLVSTLAGHRIQAQDSPPSGPATQPAKPAVIAPVSAETKQVDVPATPEKTAQKKAPVEQKNADGQMSGQPSNGKGLRGAYIIGPEDALSIRVWDQPNLSGPVTVGPDGMISLPLIDEVRAEGLTTEQLKRTLTEKLRSFINEPDVNVLMIRANSRKCIIQGEVNRPGQFSITGDTHIMEALVFAGGFREFANPKKIYLLRQEEDASGKKSAAKKYKFNYKEVSQGKHMEQNILVKNGDLIFVP